jgi:hypothetical protein
VEERWIDSSDYSTKTNKQILVQRELSQAMIPGSRLTKVEIDQSTYEARMAPVLPHNVTTTTTTTPESS